MFMLICRPTITSRKALFTTLGSGSRYMPAFATDYLFGGSHFLGLHRLDTFCHRYYGSIHVTAGGSHLTALPPSGAAGFPSTVHALWELPIMLTQRRFVARRLTLQYRISTRTRRKQLEQKQFTYSQSEIYTRQICSL